MYLTVLTFIQDGNKDMLAKEGNLINFNLDRTAFLLITKNKQDTPIHCAVMDFQAREGLMTVDEGVMDTGEAQINATGDVSLRDETLPLADELAKVTSTYAERYHVTASLDTEGDPRPVPADATVALLRVAQEALVNAAKHGAGKPVTVRLDYGAAEVRLTVSNEVDATARGTVELNTANAGYGLTGMRERLRILKGTLEAGREDNCWIVTAQVPLPGGS